MKKLKLVLQKTGRLHEGSINLLKDCGIDIYFGNSFRLQTQALNYPMEIFFIRDDDIPLYIKEGVAHLGIVGKNIVLETNNNYLIEEKLNFGYCRLSIAVPANKVSIYKDLKKLEGKRIGTSFPNLLSFFLKKNNIYSSIYNISGSVEVSPSIGISDAVCDIVSSGVTLLLNNLKEIKPILYSEAVLICCPNLKNEQKILAKRLILRVKSVKKAFTHKFIIFNIPRLQLKNIYSFLPSMKSPTVLHLPLNNFAWSAVQIVLPEDILWKTIESLKKYDAQDVLIFPIKNIV